MHEMTASNLRSSYGGESMAAMRYTVWASKAGNENLPNVQRLFRATAHSEQIHAWNHFTQLANVPGNATVTAGAGFGLAKTVDHLEWAAGGEGFEIDEMYPMYILTAEAQGEKGAANSMKKALEAEKVHQALFRKAKAAVEAGGDFEDTPIQVCDMCGFTMHGEAPDECPLCGAKKADFITF